MREDRKMKARVKATGEIIELFNMEFDEDGNEYYRDELEFIDDYEPDYWEKLKHQYAGMAMQGLLTNPKLCEIETSISIASTANTIASALINKLKEESHE